MKNSIILLLKNTGIFNATGKVLIANRTRSYIKYVKENKAGHVSELHWKPSQTTAPNDNCLLTLIVKSLVVERDGTK